MSDNWVVQHLMNTLDISNILMDAENMRAENSRILLFAGPKGRRENTKKRIWAGRETRIHIMAGKTPVTFLRHNDQT